MSRLFIDENTGLIKKLRVTEAITSYSFLVSPRPVGNLQEGQYGAELIITDPETISLIKQYTKEVAQTAITSAWGKVPKALGKPYRLGNEDKEREAGAFILRTNSPKFQPSILIRDLRTGRAHHITEDEKDEIYSGMLADVDVTFKPWAVGGKFGVTAYLNAVCKVGDGEPFASTGSLEDSFSVDLGFDDEDSFDEPVKKAPTRKQTEDKVQMSLDDLLDIDEADEVEVVEKPVKKAPAKKTTTKTTPKKEVKELTIDDLL